MNGRFPSLNLPVALPMAPMDATLEPALPTGAGWQFEPRWDGFRCLIFRDGRVVVLQSRAGEPLTRYFPELVMAASALPVERFALDGEIVVIGREGRLSYEDLAQRIHPSARRVAQLSGRSPATFLATDLLAEGDTLLTGEPLTKRRKALEAFFKKSDAVSVHLSPATTRRPQALGWLKELGEAGVDGIVARKLADPYVAGKGGAVWYRPRRTARCVIGGLRRGDGGKDIATLLLGLVEDDGLIHFVGASAPLSAEARAAVHKLVASLGEAPGFTGRTPASEGRIGHSKVRDWEPLRPVLVCEVEYDHFDGDHFRHPPTFLGIAARAEVRKASFDQVRVETEGGASLDVLGL